MNAQQKQLIITKIKHLATATKRDHAFHEWLELRKCSQSGRVDIAHLPAHVWSEGDGVFWTVSTKQPGEVYIKAPVKALEILEAIAKLKTV